MKENRNAVKIVLAIILAILMVIFALQNKDNTIIHFWFWETNLPLVLSLMLMLVIGFIVCALAAGPFYFSNRRKSKLIKDMEQRIDMLEKENKELKDKITG